MPIPARPIPIQSRVSQTPCHWYFGPNLSLAVLWTVGGLAASQASINKRPVAVLPVITIKNASIRCWMLPGVQNCPSLRTTELQKLKSHNLRLALLNLWANKDQAWIYIFRVRKIFLFPRIHVRIEKWSMAYVFKMPWTNPECPSWFSIFSQVPLHRPRLYDWLLPWLLICTVVYAGFQE